MNRSIKNITQIIEALLGKRPGSACSKEKSGEDYAGYLKANAPSQDELDAQKLGDAGGPVFAIKIMGTEEAKLKRTAASLALQTYGQWKTVTDPMKEPWDYILHMQAGDTLSPDALYEFANAAKESDLIYCDEDYWSKEGRCDPFFKWKLSSYTQLSFDMLGSGAAASRGLFEKVGEMEGGTPKERYGYNLKCALHAAYPKHITKVLYTCGSREETDFSSRSDVQSAAGDKEIVLPGKWRGSFVSEAKLPKVRGAVIILCQNDCDSLMRLLSGIDRCPMPKHTGIVIADRGSTDRRTLKFYEILENNKAAKVLRLGDITPPTAFNRAMEKADVEAAVLMHSSVEVVSPNWFNDLLCQVMRKGVGAAGPKILDEQGRLLHTGTVVGIGGWAGSAYRGDEEGGRDSRKRQFTETLRQVSGLSSCCMMVRSENFFDAGCFDESFEEAGFDTEFCIRLYRKKLACLYAPASVVKCHGGLINLASASDKDKTRSYDAMRPMLMEGDPFYSPNFDYASSIPKVAVKPQPAIYLNEKYNK